MILYYSCSQNSKYVAEKFSEAYGEPATSMNDGVKNDIRGDYYSDTPFIIIAPIFNMRVPHELESYLKQASFRGSNEVIFIATCSYSSGNARGLLRTIFKSKGLNFFYNVVIMPSTNAFGKSKMSDNSKQKVIERANQDIVKIAHTIKTNSPLLQASVSLVGVIGSALNPLIVKNLSDKKLQVSADCTLCGECRQVCNLNNIDIAENKVTFKGNCNHCSACVNLCPQKAIKVK